VIRGLSILLLAGSAWAGNVADVLKDANRHLRAGERGKAVAVLEGALEEHPSSLEAHVLYQDILVAAGKTRDLLATYKERVGESVESRYLYARLLKGRRAVSALRRLTKDAPEFARGWSAYARALRESGKIDDAVEAAARAVELDPKLGEAREELGAAHEEIGDDAAAEKQYRAALATRLNARFRLAHLLVRTGRGPEALAAIGDAEKTAPGDPYVFIHKGLVLAALGKDKEAVEAYGAAVKAVPDDALVLVLLAQSYAEIGEWKLAKQAIGRALGIDPDLAPAHAAEGFVAFREGELDRARAAYKKASRLDPSNASYLYYQGLIEERERELRKAAKFYKAAAGRDPEEPAYLLALGSVLEERGQAKKAFSAYEDATEVAPENADAWTRFGHVAADLNRFKTAAEAFNKALELRPGDLGVLLSLGIVYETGLRMKAEAIDCYRRYLAKGGKDARVREWLKALED